MTVLHTLLQNCEQQIIWTLAECPKQQRNYTSEEDEEGDDNDNDHETSKDCHLDNDDDDDDADDYDENDDVVENCHLELGRGARGVIFPL